MIHRNTRLEKNRFKLDHVVPKRISTKKNCLHYRFTFSEAQQPLF